MTRLPGQDPLPFADGVHLPGEVHYIGQVDGRDRLKYGYSANLRARRQRLAKEGVTLYAAWPGTESEERRWHLYFRTSRDPDTSRAETYLPHRALVDDIINQIWHAEKQGLCVIYMPAWNGTDLATWLDDMAQAFEDQDGRRTAAAELSQTLISEHRWSALPLAARIDPGEERWFLSIVRRYDL